MEQFVHGGNIYETKPVTGEWLDFSANVNMLGLAHSVREAVVGGIDQVVHYPDPEARELKQAISQHYNLPVEQIAGLAGFGSPESLRHHFRQRLGVSPSQWRQTFRPHGN